MLAWCGNPCGVPPRQLVRDCPPGSHTPWSEGRQFWARRVSNHDSPSSLTPVSPRPPPHHCNPLHDRHLVRLLRHCSGEIERWSAPTKLLGLGPCFQYTLITITHIYGGMTSNFSIEGRTALVLLRGLLLLFCSRGALREPAGS